MKQNLLRKFIAFITLLMIVILTIPVSGTIFAEEQRNITISETILKLDSEIIPMSVYEISGAYYVPAVGILNFFSLRADFDSANGLIVLSFDQSIDTGTEFYNFLSKELHTIIDSPHRFSFGGNEFIVENLKLVSGFNFIPISKLGILFGYEIMHDEESNTVIMTNDYFLGLDYSTIAEYSRFIEENFIDFSFNNMELLKAIDFEGYSIYLIGENHAVSKNTDIHLGFIKYLNQNHGVRFVIHESGYVDTLIANEFLRIGDTALIDRLIGSARGTLAYSKENHDFYIRLYEYNQTLPENERVILLGIDVQHNYRMGLEQIRQVLETGQDTPEVILELYEIIHKEDLTYSDLKYALDMIENNHEDFIKYLGDMYLDFWFGLRSTWQAMVFYGNNSDMSIRAQFIIDNILDMYTAFEIERTFGMFGGSHTMLNGMFGNTKSIANFLNTEFEPTIGRVLSIMCIYENSYWMAQRTGESMPLRSVFGQTLSRMLAQAAEGDTGISSTGQISFWDGALSDVFQYMLLVNNSPAATPLSELN